MNRHERYNRSPAGQARRHRYEVKRSQDKDLVFERNQERTRRRRAKRIQQKEELLRGATL